MALSDRQMAALRQQVKEEKAERAARRAQRPRTNNSRAFELRGLRAIGAHARRGADYHVDDDLACFLITAGMKSSSVGPVTTYGVREKYLERTGKGWYRLGSKAIPL